MHFSSRPFVLLALSVTSVVASPLACFEDNPARALERFSSEAGSFCTQYLGGSKSVPYWLTEYPATRVSSACSCYTSKIGPASLTPTQTPSKTPSSAAVPTTEKPILPTASLPATTPKPSTSTKPSVSEALPVAISTQNSVAPSTKPSSAPVQPKSVAASRGKRGLLYDYTSSDYSKYFVGSPKVTFGSDYHATRGETGAILDKSFGFVPTLSVDHNSLLNLNWINTVKDLITNQGVTTVYA